jgi:hypothetical protein
VGIALLKLGRRAGVTVSALAERVLGRDLGLGNAEKPQDHRCDQPGAFLARDAMKHRRHGARLDDGSEEDRQAVGAVGEDLLVAKDREVRAGDLRRVPLRRVGHDVDERQVVVPHPMTGQVKSASLPNLARSTAVDDRRDADLHRRVLSVVPVLEDPGQQRTPLAEKYLELKRPVAGEFESLPLPPLHVRNQLVIAEPTHVLAREPVVFISPTGPPPEVQCLLEAEFLGARTAIFASISR